MRLSAARPFTTSLKTCSTARYSSAPRILSSIRNMSSSGTPSFSDLGIENTNIKVASGVELSQEQKVIVGSVLDLFAGRPSLKKLQLWKDDAVFQDNITKAEGRKQFEPQWYGLQSAFSAIERLHQEVTSAGNPIEMDMKTKYTVKGVGMEQTITSKILIYTEGGKITQVQDKWNGQIPEGVFATAMRNLNSVVVPMFVGVPKNEEEDKKRGN